MPNFDKIARFELLNNFVNYDFYGEYKETYQDIDGFPTVGHGKVIVDIKKCTSEDWQKGFYNFSEKGFEELMSNLLEAGVVYCIKEPEKLKLFGSQNTKIRSYLTLDLVECSGQTCLSDEQKKKIWLGQQYQQTTMFNDQIYHPEIYEREKIIESASSFTVDYISFAPYTRKYSEF